MSARNRSTDRAVAVETTRPLPAKDATRMVLLGLVASDGSGELAFCSDETRAPYAILLDMSTASGPDADGDFVVPCARCERAHWTISFVRFVKNYGCDFESGVINLLPERFLAETIVNLRTRVAMAVRQ